MLALIFIAIVHLTLPPEHQRYDERYRTTATDAIGLLEDWFGAMSDDEITIVHRSARRSPVNQDAVVVNTRWRVGRYGRTLENDVVSALSQHYWSRPDPLRPEDDWLAEGLAEYSRARVMQQLFPEGGPLERRFFGGFVPYALRDTPVSPLPDASNRAALALVTLERYIGWSALQQALSEFAPRWRSGDGGLGDLTTAINTAAGRDLSWFYSDAFDPQASFDFGIEQLSSESVGEGTYRTVVVVRRFGSASFPGSASPRVGPFGPPGAIEIEVKFAGDEEVRERWDGRAETMTFTYESHSPATSAAVDPDEVLALDTPRANNRRELVSLPDRRTWDQRVRWLTWVQDLLLTYSFFI